MTEIKPIKIDCKNLRLKRQEHNQQILIDYINQGDSVQLIKNCNKKELDRVLKDLNLSVAELLKQCSNIYFTKLLVGRISKLASRQGKKDEKLVLNLCSETAKKVGVQLKQLTSMEYWPVKNGGIADIRRYKTLNKMDCLKSFDAKIEGKCEGWIFAKITYSNGGHQDNVFEEAYHFCEWVKKYGKKDELYVVMLDTDLQSKFDNIKNAFSSNNLLIVNHYSFQKYLIKKYS